MKKFYDFLKGLPIGISNVVPGFSGGTMAVILNIYERLINAISDFFHHPRKVIQDIWALLLGIIVGIIIAITLIAFLLINFPIPTSLFFIGLVIGSIPNILEKTKKYKVKVYDVMIFFISITLVISVSVFKGKEVTEYVLNFRTYLILFFVSIIAASSMVIPGVSGSMILLSLGYYNLIWVEVLHKFLNSLKTFDIELILDRLFPVVVFGIAALLGIVVIAKMIKVLMKKYHNQVYFAILGLLFASPFAIIVEMYDEYQEQIDEANLLVWIVGIIFMIIGAMSVSFMSHRKVKNNAKTEES